VELVRENHGSRALYLVQSYGITSFGQLQRACELAGLRTWRDPLTEAEIRQREEAKIKKERPFEESLGDGKVHEVS
jgi:hypothetical protein